MDQEIFKAVQAKLDALKVEIEQEVYKGYRGLSPTDGWGGAGIGFSTVPVYLGESGFYPNPRIVVTAHAHACGWLLEQFCALFFTANLIDSCSKIEFFGRLALAAQRYQAALDGSSEKCNGLLRAILGEANQIVAEMQQGTFNCLMVAVDNEIVADHSGYHIDESHVRYFAYGSNMDEKQMNERCPGADIVGKARLMNYLFIINKRGVATIVPAPGHTVHGLVWQVSRENEVSLDHSEGVRFGTYTKQCIPVSIEGSITANALVYVAIEADAGDAARHGYLEKILQALYRYEMPDEYIDEISFLRRDDE